MGFVLFAVCGGVTLRVLISRLAVILFYQKGNGHGCRRVLVVAGRLLEHVVVELAEDGDSVSELQRSVP